MKREAWIIIALLFFFKTGHAQTISLPPAAGTTITGSIAGDYAGETIISAGDINGDARADLIVTARNYTPTTRQGQVYIIYGQAAGLPSSIALSSVGTTVPGVKITGLSGSYTGAVVAVGDVNGDMKNDILINDWSGQSVYLLYGSATLPAAITISSISTTVPGVKIFSGVWTTSISIGDFNKDGNKEIVIWSDN